MRARQAFAPSAQRGFALIALLALLTAGVLFFVVDRLDAATLKRRQDEVTAEALAQAKDALIAYAITYREVHPGEVYGYLPCPDMTGNGSGNAGNCGNAGQTVVGLLPFKQLGLTNLHDGAGECLWYAVSGSFKAALNKPEPMNWDTQGVTEVQDSAGNVLSQPDDSNGGVAAVVFAPGLPLSGQSRSTFPASICNVNPADYVNYLDGTPNGTNPNTPYSFPSSANPVIVIHGTSNATDSNNNDHLIWITTREIFARIKQRRDELNNESGALISSGIASIHSQLNSASSLPPPDTGNMLPTNIFPIGTAEYKFHVNWKDHFRYLRCPTSPATPGCYTINGASCNGVLLFGGATANGHPRTSAGRNDPDYFDASTLDLISGTVSSFAGANSYDGSTDASRATDLGLCLTAALSP